MYTMRITEPIIPIDQQIRIKALELAVSVWRNANEYEGKVVLDWAKGFEQFILGEELENDQDSA